MYRVEEEYGVNMNRGWVFNNLLVGLPGVGGAISPEDALQGHNAPPPSPVLLYYFLLSPLDIETTGRIKPRRDRKTAPKKATCPYGFDVRGGGGLDYS